MGERKSSIVRKAEKLVESVMKGNDASHDAAHAFRVRDLALSLAHEEEEGLASSPETIQIVELAALLHDIGDYKYLRDPSDEAIVERFLLEENVEESERMRILDIINRMGKNTTSSFSAGDLSGRRKRLVKAGDRQSVLNEKSPGQKELMRKRIPLKETRSKGPESTISEMQTETGPDVQKPEKAAKVNEAGSSRPFVFESQRPNVPIAPGSLAKAVKSTMLEFHDSQDATRIGAEIMERMVGYENKGLFPEKLDDLYGLAGTSMYILANVINFSKESARHFSDKCSQLEQTLKDSNEEHDRIVQDIIEGKSKMTQDLQAAKNAAEVAMKERTVLDQKVKDLVSENERLKAKLNDLVNTPSTVNAATRQAIIDDAREEILNQFRESADFTEEIKKIAEPMFEEGGLHVLRFLFGKGLPIDAQTACDAAAAEFFGAECLEGHKMVPYAETDLEKAQAKHPDWIVPDAAESNIRAMLDNLFNEPAAEVDGGEIVEIDDSHEEA